MEWTPKMLVGLEPDADHSWRTYIPYNTNYSAMPLTLRWNEADGYIVELGQEVGGGGHVLAAIGKVWTIEAAQREAVRLLKHFCLNTLDLIMRTDV